MSSLDEFRFAKNCHNSSIETMEKFNQKEIFNICAKLYQNFSVSLKRSELVKKFIDLGISRATSYRMYTKLESGVTEIRKKGTGLSASKLNNSNIGKIKRSANNKVFRGYRYIGRKINAHHSTIKRYIKKIGIFVRKRKSRPKVTQDQKKRQKTRVRKLRYAIKGKEAILDDESYFDLEGFNFYGSDRYAFQSLDNVPDEIKFKDKSKFSPKLLVWIAIGKRGHCKPYFHLTKGAVNSEIYSGECLTKRLIPWLRETYSGANIIFWPDLASCHYSRKSLETLEGAGIEYIKKLNNPPNVPQLRPIEDFWANLKCKVFSDGFIPKSKDQLIKRIKMQLKNFDQKYFDILLCNLNSKIIRADKFGCDTLIH